MTKHDFLSLKCRDGHLSDKFNDIINVIQNTKKVKLNSLKRDKKEKIEFNIFLSFLRMALQSLLLAMLTVGNDHTSRSLKYINVL